MKDYSLLLSLEKLLIKNYVGNLLKNPKRLLFYMTYILLMSFIVYNNINNVNRSNSMSDYMAFKEYMSAGAFVLIFMLAYGLTKKSSIFFKLSEINLIFTAPLDPRKVLMFNLFKKIPVYLLTSTYTLVFLLSMVIRVFEPSFYAVLITGIGYTMVFLILEPLSFCLFVLQTKSKKNTKERKSLLPFFITIGVYIVYEIFLSSQTMGLSLRSLVSVIGSSNLDWIPILGWGKQLTMTAVNGISASTFLYLGLMFTVYLGLLLLTYYLGNDFYEDVIITSEEKNTHIKSAKEGRLKFSRFSLNKKNVTIKDKAMLSGALDWKRKLLLKRSDLSMYVSIETILCVVMSVGLLILGDADYKLYGLYITSGIYFYIKFLFSMQSALDTELKMPYFYLIPDSAINKILAVTRLDFSRFFVNALVLSGSHMILWQHIQLEFVLMPIALTLFYSILLLSSFMFNMLLPSEDFRRLQLLFKLLQMFVLLIPSGLTMIIIGATTDSALLALMGSIVVNVLISGIVLGLSDVFYNKLELK